MKTFTASLFALAASLSLVAALPSTSIQKSRRSASWGVEVTLIGAETNNPADQYSVWVSFGSPTESELSLKLRSKSI